MSGLPIHGLRYPHARRPSRYECSTEGSPQSDVRGSSPASGDEGEAGLMAGLCLASAQADNLKDRLVTGNSGVSKTPPS